MIGNGKNKQSPCRRSGCPFLRFLRCTHGGANTRVTAVFRSPVPTPRSFLSSHSFSYKLYYHHARQTVGLLVIYLTTAIYTRKYTAASVPQNGGDDGLSSTWTTSRADHNLFAVTAARASVSICFSRHEYNNNYTHITTLPPPSLNQC